ncbi:aminopeptidase N [Candidatus Symbiobacter mobilis]|uniref:Aminopeptidase N n=1 Tax=Candidatus Symbiobacter mobilis CR TaxID=946483 RepID=U5N8G5_9BURK|nr:aminopeptidase N [Candidatus Symbiobacter mobilis]AGX87697.1 aminopeptidase N [Candidatus Symbiobacter mobilis CR]
MLPTHPSAARAIHRADYRPPAFWIDTVALTFDLDPAKTRVLNRMTLRRNPAVAAQALRLDGEDLSLVRVLCNGAGTSFRLEEGVLVLEKLPSDDKPFELEIFTTCTPVDNTRLMGLYVSQDTFTTQCEPEGFRRITYFLDRPDVMARFTVTLRADRDRYPVLLSNGNLVDSGPLDGNRHMATWEDPFRKPCYLFALVAGKLACREQRVVSRTGKEHLLQVYVRPADIEKTEHAMQSLCKSVVWDESRFGLSLDLERYMIVATSDFNMGAMENKGLNIFNSKYVLAARATATDADFANIERVIGHEYFHNWTGNRITCRDWFQLSLKEGLTVFRDQEFSMDLCAQPSARAVQRISEVRDLRTVQFAEDASPVAHPVRPDSYVEINNFYTATVYEKGAEVVRMMQTLVGREGFAAGMRLYFERHDGSAVTCEDFLRAVSDANPGSLLATRCAAFERWYSQAGTPRIVVSDHYDPDAATYTLHLAQNCPQCPGQATAAPFVLPIALGLVGARTGAALPLHPQSEIPGRQDGDSLLVVLDQSQCSLRFEQVQEPPVPSLLRGFSAPAIVQYAYSDDQLYTLLANDTDPFNRWEAGQRLALQHAVAVITSGTGTGDTGALSGRFLDAMRGVLRHPGLDPAFKDLVLTLPSEAYISEQLDVVDPQRIHAVREAMRTQLATALQEDWQWAYEQHGDNGGYRFDPVSCGRRALCGLALAYLCLAAEVEQAMQAHPVWPGKAYQRCKDADNMTDRFHALSALVHSGNALAQPALARFYEQFRSEELVIDKWFALQAGCNDRGGQVLSAVRKLLQHPDFTLRNPNRARSVIFSYCLHNPGAFHRVDAGGYVLWGEQVLAIDAINPQVAARLVRAMDNWKKLAQPYRDGAFDALSRLAGKADLSKDVRELVTRVLAD